MKFRGPPPLCEDISAQQRPTFRRPVSKSTRRIIAAGEAGASTDSPIMVIGDKSKAQLSRALGNNLALTFNQIGRDIPTFADAAGVADLIIKSGVEYDSVAIVYNKFVSAISYEPAIMEVLNEEQLKESRTFLSFVASYSTGHSRTRLWLIGACVYSWLQGIRDGG